MVKRTSEVPVGGQPGTFYGGPFLGSPGWGRLGRATLPKLVSGSWWSARRHEWRNNRVTLPLPLDVVKPEMFLPHSTVAARAAVAPLPSAPVDLSGVRWLWAGRERSIAEYVHTTAVDSILFMHDGAVVAEYYGNGWSAENTHHGWSTTKSFVSTLIGIARDAGMIDSLDDPAGKYVADLLGTAWESVTIKHILQMRSGVHWDEHTAKVGENTQFLQWVELIRDYRSGGRRGKTRNEFLASLPYAQEQGVAFNYNSANTQVLAWILEEIYGQPFNEVLSELLWKPAGMEAPATIMTDRTGAAIASEELFARPRDFARLGELMRNRGVAVDGTRVVSAEWVTEATTAMNPAKDYGDEKMGGYGYQWWSGATEDGFQANGFQGQFITVSPAAGVTGVRMAHTLTFDRNGAFAGQGNPEWQEMFRAVVQRLSA